MGPLMGGRLTVLRNGNVPCRYFCDCPVDFKIVPMSPVEFNKRQFPLSLFQKFPHDFKVVQCRLLNLRKVRVALSNLRGQSPPLYAAPLELWAFVRVDLGRRGGGLGVVT